MVTNITNQVNNLVKGFESNSHERVTFRGNAFSIMSRREFKACRDGVTIRNLDFLKEKVIEFAKDHKLGDKDLKEIATAIHNRKVKLEKKKKSLFGLIFHSYETNQKLKGSIEALEGIHKEILALISEPQKSEGSNTSRRMSDNQLENGFTFVRALSGQQSERVLKEHKPEVKPRQGRISRMLSLFRRKGSTEGVKVTSSVQQPEARKLSTKERIRHNGGISVFPSGAL